jgi:hypothetical protein
MIWVCLLIAINHAASLLDHAGHKRILPILSLGSKPLEWRSNFKYLGISYVFGYNLYCDTSCTVRKFCAASDCIFNNTYGLDDLLQVKFIAKLLSANTAIWYSSS